jgi:hypothetical protein
MRRLLDGTQLRASILTLFQTKMKNLFTLGLGVALLAGSLNALAQQRRPAPSYDLGSSQALASQLRTQLATRAARLAAPAVTLQVSATQAFTGKVNYRAPLAKTGEYLVGELAGVAGGSFQLRVQEGRAEGYLVLRAARQAYQYATDGRGNVRIEPVDINKVVCVDYNKPLGYREAPPTQSLKEAANATAAVVSLQSLPGARGCILLDADGYALPAGTGWNNGNAYNAPSANMTDANLQAMWELVSEDFRPFSLNVTTDENVFNSYPKNMRMRCVVSPGSGSTIAPGAGGVAFLTSFKTNDDTPCWVFMADPKSGGEAASHEVGHTLGLSHDGRQNPDEGYYTGQDNSGAWAPIMGAGYYKAVTHWSRGEYGRANNQEDDLAIMSSATYNVGYRPDDHSNGTSGATNLARSGSSLTGQGLIERTSDQDYFAFSTSGGTASFAVNTVGRYGNLDIVARLFNSSGALLGTYDTGGGGNLNVSFSTSLGAGTYYLQIDGTSSGNPATDGYSDYGSLGTFSISGSAPAPAGSAGVATFYQDCNYGGTAVALPVGDYSLAALQQRGILNDDISSLTVSSGYQVILYEDDNYAGNGVILTASNSCLVNVAVAGGNWNDRASSLRVQASSSFSRQLEAEVADVNNGMTVESCAEGGQDMGNIDQGDYLVWNNLVVPVTGQYLLEYRVASAASGGTISADLNAGTIQLGNTSIPATGGWQNWTTVAKTVSLNAGTYNFGVYAQTGGYNLNWVRISRAGAARLAASAAPEQPAADLTRLELYPNPVVDRLELHAAKSLAGSQYRILDNWGRVVAAGATSGTINVAALQAGSYTLQLVSEGRAQFVQRFVK